MSGRGKSQAGYLQVKCGNPPSHITVNSLGVQEPICPHLPSPSVYGHGLNGVWPIGNEPGVRNTEEESQEGKDTPTAPT